MSREDGFYWVMDKEGEWIIAEWYRSYSYPSWQVIGQDIYLNTSDFLEIDECRI